MDEQVVRDQIAGLRREQNILNDRLRSLRPAPQLMQQTVDEVQLARVCRAVDRWLDEADDEKRQVALEALQISVVATRERATVSGMLPLCDLTRRFAASEP